MIKVGSPVGTLAERESGIIWPGSYFDATGFARRYRIGSPYEAYHTGVDLNNNLPRWDSDKNAPVYAVAPGIVTCAAVFPVWGWIVVIHHEDDKQPYYARYAHVMPPQVGEGDRVECGVEIARIGNANGTQPYHLHFDISPTDALKLRPADWPKLNIRRLYLDYVDPQAWLQARITPYGVNLRKLEVTADVLMKRIAPRKTAQIIGRFYEGNIVSVINAPPIAASGHIWQQLADKSGWIAVDYTMLVSEDEPSE